MNILSTAGALQAINASLKRPITRQLFAQSIIPLMLQCGDAQRIGQGHWLIVDGNAARNWASYIAWREAQITAGKLPPKHPYSIIEMEEHFHGQHD